MTRAQDKSGNLATGGNVTAISAALLAAAEAPHFDTRDSRQGDQIAQGERYDTRASGSGADGVDRPVLPAEAPVKALGQNIQSFYYLNALGQLVVLSPRDHGKNNINGLFSPHTHLPRQYWPQWSQPKPAKTDKDTGEVIEEAQPSKITGFKQDVAAEALIGACGDAGIFDEFGRVRQRGAHYGRGGALILHLGDTVMVCGRRADGSAAKPVHHLPGVLDNMVYPADDPTPRPWPEPVEAEAGERMLGHLRTWHWERALIDPMLMLGAVAQGFIGGAPLWRSHIIVTGGAGTGKSTLNGQGQTLDQLYGRGAIRSAHATEAAVRQKLQAKTIPVIFDEFEATELNGAKLNAILELARISSSGDTSDKGGADHKAQSFTLRSSFIFSAILPPRLKPQDQSRFAVLELLPLAADTPKLDLAAWQLPDLGRLLSRRMIQGWPRYEATLDAYRAAFGKRGHTKRAQDTYCTLLACADLLLFDHVPDAELLDHWAELCAPAEMRETIEATSEHDECLAQLKSVMVQAKGGEERVPMGRWIESAVAEAKAPRDALGDAASTFRERVSNYGLKLVSLKPKARSSSEAAQRYGAKAWDGVSEGYLAVAASGVGLAQLFTQTRWSGGNWSTALGRVPGAVKGVPMKIGTGTAQAVCVPLSAVLTVEMDDDDAEGAA